MKLKIEVEISGIENWETNWNDEKIKQKELTNIEDELKYILKKEGFGDKSQIMVECKII